MAKNRCVIITGGDPTAGLSGLIRGDDFVIACDRGVGYAAKENVTPDLIIGDFDSYGGPLPENVPVTRLPSEKDDTDTMAALRYAEERGFSEVLLACALGGKRFDHTVANLQTMAHGASAGLTVTLEGDGVRMICSGPATREIKKEEGAYLSLFAMSGEVSGVDLTGVKYPLSGGKLMSSFPLGVSNEWTEGAARISHKSGILLIVISEK